MRLTVLASTTSDLELNRGVAKGGEKCLVIFLSFNRDVISWCTVPLEKCPVAILSIFPLRIIE